MRDERERREIGRGEREKRQQKFKSEEWKGERGGDYGGGRERESTWKTELVIVIGGGVF